jgi:hypothetical protein
LENPTDIFFYRYQFQKHKSFEFWNSDEMDVQRQSFRSFNLCYKVLKFIGIAKDNKFTRSFWMLFHFLCLNGLLLCATWSLKFENDEWKVAEKIHLIIGTLGLNIKFICICSGIDKFKTMKEQVGNIFTKLCDEETDEKSNEAVKKESRHLNKVYIIFSTLILGPLTASVISMPLLRKLPFEINYPFSIDDKFGFLAALIHQVYCYFFGFILKICSSFLSVAFISYSIGLLGKINIQLYYKVGMNRQNVIMNSMESYEMIRRLIDEVRKHFELFLLIQSLNNIVQLGFLIFIASETNESANCLKAMFLCLPQILEVFIPCNFGQDLINSSKETIKAFSFPKWENVSETIEMARVKFLRRNKIPINIELKKIMRLNIMKFLIFISSTILPYLFFVIIKNLN